MFRHFLWFTVIQVKFRVIIQVKRYTEPYLALTFWKNNQAILELGKTSAVSGTGCLYITLKMDVHSYVLFIDNHFVHLYTA